MFLVPVLTHHLCTEILLDNLVYCCSYKTSETSSLLLIRADMWSYNLSLKYMCISSSKACSLWPFHCTMEEQCQVGWFTFLQYTRSFLLNLERVHCLLLHNLTILRHGSLLMARFHTWVQQQSICCVSVAESGQW